MRHPVNTHMISMQIAQGQRTSMALLVVLIFSLNFRFKFSSFSFLESVKDSSFQVCRKRRDSSLDLLSSNFVYITNQVTNILLCPEPLCFNVEITQNGVDFFCPAPAVSKNKQQKE